MGSDWREDRAEEGKAAVTVSTGRCRVGVLAMP